MFGVASAVWGRVSRILETSLCWLVLLVVTACARSPFTGRRSLQLFPAGQLEEMAAAEYREFLEQNEVSEDPAVVEPVRRTGERLALAAQVALEGEGSPELLEGYEWEFNVIESKEANAFVLPGGKVVVFSGLLPITRDEDGLAIVLGHEMAHSIAEHGNERLSQLMTAQLGGVALDVALQNYPAQMRQLFMTAYGVGANVGVLLPYSRAQESEADEIGLYLAAIAGYEPRAAAPFWERLSQLGGPSPPEFLSTHPDPENRAKELRELVPRALEYRERYGPELQRRLRSGQRKAGRFVLERYESAHGVGSETPVSTSLATRT